MQQQLRRSVRRGTRKESLNGRIARQITVHRSAVVAGNSLVQSSRNVDEPLIFEVPGFSGKVLIILSCHETSLIENGLEALTNVAKGFNDTRLNPFARGGGIGSPERSQKEGQEDQGMVKELGEAPGRDQGGARRKAREPREEPARSLGRTREG